LLDDVGIHGARVVPTIPTEMSRDIKTRDSNWVGHPSKIPQIPTMNLHLRIPGFGRIVGLNIHIC